MAATGGAPTKQNEKRRCTATNRKGTRCGRWAIAGGTVCPNHGGAAPQVKRAARIRLLQLVDPAIATLAQAMTRGDKWADRIRAANSILDRTGYAKGITVDVTMARQELTQRLIELRDAQLDDEDNE